MKTVKDRISIENIFDFADTEIQIKLGKGYPRIWHRIWYSVRLGVWKPINSKVRSEIWIKVWDMSI